MNIYSELTQVQSASIHTVTRSSKFWNRKIMRKKQRDALQFDRIDNAPGQF